MHSTGDASLREESAQETMRTPAGLAAVAWNVARTGMTARSEPAAMVETADGVSGVPEMSCGPE